MYDNVLFVIPARGGSKGLPGKNIKPLLGKPLIHYSIDYARLFVSDRNICLSTDDIEVVNCAKEIGLEVEFLRPYHLSSDTADTFGVLKHAFDFKRISNPEIDTIVLLQPTSPFREKFHFEEAFKIYNDKIEMVVSVCQTKSNPYFTLFEEDEEGILKICKGDGRFSRRQDAPPVFEYNGSIYIINKNTLIKKNFFGEIQNKVKYLMDEKYSVDIDTIDDWNFAEYTFSKIR
jgi:CMP-N,N'-diacetyllegionaminic acid synthase